MALVERIKYLLCELGITNSFLAYLIFVACAFILLLITLYWLKFLFKKPRLLAYKTDKGIVQVNTGAISDLVQSVCKKDSDISQLKTKIIPKRKNLNIQIHLRIDSGSCLKSIEETLQSEIRGALRQGLGIENIGFINIIATGIKDSRKAQSRPESLN